MLCPNHELTPNIPFLSPDGTGGTQLPPLMHQEGRDLLDNTAELDYLTHIVIRM
jgi:hypothetical protein